MFVINSAASEENVANSLLPLVNALIHELERIESAQVVRADVMLPTDSAGVSHAAKQQKVSVYERVHYCNCFHI